jgi:hypothetical protein
MGMAVGATDYIEAVFFRSEFCLEVLFGVNGVDLGTVGNVGTRHKPLHSPLGKIAHQQPTHLLWITVKAVLFHGL